MIHFGYGIHPDRQIVFDENDRTVYQKLREQEQTIDNCIQCGTCASGCTTAQFTAFSLRRVILNLHRGEMAGMREEISRCMFCSKCQLACPREVNTRNVIQVLYTLLN